MQIRGPNDKDKTRKKMPTWLVIILVLVVIPFWIYVFNSSISSDESGHTPKPEYTLNTEQEQAIQVLISEGQVKRFPQTHYVYVDEDLWKHASAKERAALTKTLAVWTTQKEGDDLYWGTVHGLYTHKKLAKWSETFGYKEFY